MWRYNSYEEACTGDVENDAQKKDLDNVMMILAGSPTDDESAGSPLIFGVEADFRYSLVKEIE